MSNKLTPVSIRSRRRLSSSQRALYASQRRHPNSPLQNTALLAHLDGAVDASRLRSAFATVLEASDVLRSQLVPNVESGDIDVLIAPDPQFTTELVQLEREQVAEWATARSRRLFDLTECAYDSVVIEHPDGTTSWYLNLHHVVTDATSSALVFEATAAAYGGETLELAPYYLRDDDESASRTRRERAESHWAARAPMPRIGQLYQSADRREPQSSRIAVPTSSTTLERAAARVAADYQLLTESMSWTALVTTATALYLHRLTAATRFSIGLPVHNRTAGELRGLIGPVMEVFPVDIEIHDGDTNRVLHQRVSGQVLNTLRRAHPGTAPSPDYDAVVNVIPGRSPDLFGDVPATITWLNNGAVDPDHLLRVHLTEYLPGAGTYSRQANQGQTARYELSLDVNDGVATETERGLAGGHFLATLNELIENPDALLGSYTLCSEVELEQIIAWESTPDFPNAATDLVLGLAQALQGNQRVVLSDATRSLSGDEVWQWVVCVADSLIESGVGTGDRVGIDFERSVESVVAIFATMVAGGAFVPFDSTQPIRRRDALAEQARCSRVLGSRQGITRLQGSLDQRDFESRSASLLSQVRSADDEAYVLFTSGSTGQPKAVPITRRGIAAYVRFAETAYFDADPSPVAPLFGSLAFDLTLTSVFAPILRGGRLHVIAVDGPGALAAIAEVRDITWCKATPSHLEILLHLLPHDHCLATLVVGGESFPARLAEGLFDIRPSLNIFNEYGPTEAVVGCMIHRAVPGDARRNVPIGTPAPGVRLRIVDTYGKRVPLGVPGELWIAAQGLTTGYLDAKDETNEESFVVHDGHRYYRSGDVVRLTPQPGESGVDAYELMYMGRIDDQVKVGGIRLEPAEVEAALDRHPMIARSAVGVWSPAWVDPSRYCATCGLPDNVPGAEFDVQGVCNTCLAFEAIEPVARGWFKTIDDLQEKLQAARQRSTGAYDCVHLLSGGKDSTYALYRLVELGFRPFVLTLDNGFISEDAKANARRAVAHLGLDHEFATTDAMHEIFRDSLATHSNVCNGCYKTLYTLATNRAVELGIPMIVTGLSRGQLFETRLIPQQFDVDRFDADAIDRAVIGARKRYHRVGDAANRLLDTSAFDDDDLFESLEYLDLYRYLDVELTEVLDYLDTKTSWRRPADTGRSTNCLINVAGIHAHIIEQGYHNYAIPYAWDVRLGHKTRAEALAELDDDIDLAEVSALLAEVGYEPKKRTVLTGWIELVDQARSPSPSELRAFLGDVLPAHSIPAAFVVVDDLPLTPNGKLDIDALPAPHRTHRAAAAITVGATSELEDTIIEVWERVLKIEPIAADDDFFALGGDSLEALGMIVMLSAELTTELSQELAFAHMTPRELAAAIAIATSAESPTLDRGDPRSLLAATSETPGLSPGEQGVVFGQRAQPNKTMFNVARIFEVAGALDATRFEQALFTATARHETLRWTYTTPRRALAPEAAVSFVAEHRVIDRGELASVVHELQTRAFNLESGPLLRCVLQPIADGSTAVLFAAHHVCCDHESFDRLIAQIDQALDHRELAPLEVDYATFCSWQASSHAADRSFWLDRADSAEPAVMQTAPVETGPDGYLSRRCSLSPAEIRSGSGSTALARALVSAGLAVRPFHDGSVVEVCLVSSTRTHETARDLFGYLLNPIPVAVHCEKSRSIGELANAVTSQVGAAMPHRAYPFANIVADRRAASKPVPLGRILVAYHDAQPMRLDGLTVKQEVAFNGDSVADASFFVLVRDGFVDVGIEYSGAAVGERLAGSMLEIFNECLSTAVRSPDTLVGEVARSVGDSIIRGDELSPPPLVNDVINNLLQRQGDAIAVECDGKQLTWAELDYRAGVVGSRLRALGVSVGDRVVINLPRSVDVVAAILGAHRVGAAYVPVDPSYPDSRVDLIISAAQARATISDTERAKSSDHVVLTNDAIDGMAWSDAGDISPMVHAHDVPVTADLDAYVIFTSGSTGVPSGVPVTHGQLAASTHARSGVYVSGPTRFAMVSSFAFDSSIVGLFWTLASAGTVCLPTERVAHDVDGLAEFLGANELSHVLCVPSLYQTLLSRSGRSTSTGWPAQVIVAGEACSTALVAEHFAARPTVLLTNEYGPTEATVWATAHHCSADDARIPIGSPIPGTWIAVMNENDEVAVAGATGELIIGGANVTGGYLDDVEATQRRFGRAQDVQALNHLDGAFFRSGDRAIIADGVAYFVGRSDVQLNINGARIEPQEVEQVLLEFPGIEAALVVASDPRSLEELMDAASDDAVARAMAAAASASDSKLALVAALRKETSSGVRLAAHLETSEDIDMVQVRAAIAEVLPPPLRPSVYSVHKLLPRTPNGKLDREAAADLPIVVEPIAVAEPVPNVGSESDLDHTVRGITEIFAKILRDPTVGPNDAFLDRGGHSLLLIELLIEIEAVFDVELPTSVVFDAPTPAAIAALINVGTPSPDSAGAGPGSNDRSYRSFVVPIQPKGDKTPLFAIHNLGTDCEYWRPLAAELGTDQPLYGLGAPHKIEQFGKTAYDPKAAYEIDEIAAAYVEEIDILVPTGDVAIIGLCGGAVSAYEVAQQLRAKGRSVKVLAMINDWHAPFLDRSAEEVPVVGARRADLLSRWRNFRSKGLGYFGWAIKDAHVVNVARRRGEIWALAAAEKGGVRLPHRLQVRQYIERGLDAMHGYDYRPYDGRVAIYRGANDPNLNTPQDGLGWRDLLSNVTVTVTPGSGTQMMYQPNVAGLAAAIAADLGANDEPPTATAVESEMIDAVHSGRLMARLPSLLERTAQGNTEAHVLVQRADALCRDIAASNQQVADRVVAAMRTVGVEAGAAPLPPRMMQHVAVVSVPGSQVAAVEVLRGLGYEPTNPDLDTSQASLDFVGRSAETSTRIRLVTSTALLAPVGQSAEKSADVVSSELGGFLGTPTGLIGPLLRFAEATAGDLVVDVGCGDGRVLIGAAQTFGCPGLGIELDAGLASRARANVAAAGLSHLIEIVEGDVNVMYARIADADVVFTFLPPKGAQRFVASVLEHLSTTARLIVHEQLPLEWTEQPDQIGLVLSAAAETEGESGLTVAHLWHGQRSP